MRVVSVDWLSNSIHGEVKSLGKDILAELQE